MPFDFFKGAWGTEYDLVGKFLDVDVAVKSQLTPNIKVSGRIETEGK
jgi:hypothetical protein